MNNKTITNIIKNKIYSSIESMSVQRMILKAIDGLLVIFLAFLLSFPEKALKSAIFLLSFSEFILIKFFLSFVLVFYGKTIFLKIRKKYKPNIDTIEGIPKTELLNFLFEEKSLKLEATKKRFGINRKSFDRLAKQLEKIEVLERGKNNARILSKKYTREEIAEIIISAKKVKEIKKKMKIFRDGEIKINTPEMIDRNIQNVFNLRKI